MLQVQPPPTEDCSIVKEDLKESEIILNDGSTITVTPSFKDVKKIVGQKGPGGGACVSNATHMDRANKSWP